MKKEYYKMTKEALVLECIRLQSRNEKLEDGLEKLSDTYIEMENKVADAVNTSNDVDSIKDVELFKFRLELEGLMTPQLKSFIEYYLKYHNVVRGETHVL